MIFVLNLVGLIIGNGTELGIWIIQLIFLILSAALCFGLLFISLGGFSASFGSIIWLTTLIIIWEGNNFTEQYSMLFQFMALFLFFLYHNQSQSRLYLFLIGLIASLSFLLKQTLVGIWIAIIIFLVIDRTRDRELKKLLFEILYMLFGSIIILIIFGSYFIFNNSFEEMISAIFEYNFVYTLMYPSSRIHSLLFGILMTSISGGMLISFFSWFYFIYHLIYSQQIFQSIQNSSKSLLILLLIAFPIELVFACLSGNNYLHYYIAWTPIIAILSGYFAFIFYKPLERYRFKFRTYILYVLILLFCVFSFNVQFSRIQNSLSSSNKDEPIIKFINEHSNDDDYVLMWGAETSYNFKSGRQSPSRFVYQYPIFIEGYKNNTYRQDFLLDLGKNKPKIIIDTSFSNPKVPPIISDGWTTKLSEFVKNNYFVQDEFNENSWIAYLIKE